MNMMDKERGQHIQFLMLPSTIAVVDKGTSLHCYYVKMCITARCHMHIHLFYTFLHNSSEGMFLCLPRQLLRVEWGTVYFVLLFCPLSLSVMFIVSPHFHANVCRTVKSGAWAHSLQKNNRIMKHIFFFSLSKWEFYLIAFQKGFSEL